jgi:hypothetical protein
MAGMLLPHAFVIAYDASQIGQTATQVNQTANQAQNLFTQYTGLNLADVLEESGLKGAKAKMCIAQNTLGQVAAISNNLAAVLEDQLNRALNEAVQVIISELTVCALHALPYVGKAFPQCTIKSAGKDIEKNLRQQKEDFKNRFVGGCVAASQLADMMELAREITNQWGPDGAPVYVTNWVNDIFTEPDRRALRRMWALLVSTEICPHFRESALDYFGVPLTYRENPPLVASGELAIGANTPFQERARCTLPEGYAAVPLTESGSMAAGGGYLILERESEPQHNYVDFIDLASAELATQRAATVQAALAEATSAGGVRSIYGNAAGSCRIRDGMGSCIELTEAIQPPSNAAVIAALPINIPVEAALQQAPGPEDPPVNDMMATFANHVMSMLNQPLPFRIQFGFQNDPKVVGTPAPAATPGPDDLACTGGDARCSCVQNNATVQQSIQASVGPAMTRLQAARPELFSPPGSSQIAPGVSQRDVAQALCDNLSESPGQCVVHPSQDDEIVLILGGQTISVDVITSQGGLRSGGGTAIASCPLGVQD